jgi:hypothetical protein
VDTLEESAKKFDCINLTCPEDSCNYSVTVPRLEKCGNFVNNLLKNELFFQCWRLP